MVSGLPRSVRKPASGSLVARWLERVTPRPDTFRCGVRQPHDSDVARSRWRYRRAWIDPLREGDVMRVRLDDGEAFRLRLDDDPWWHGHGPGARSGFVVISTHSADDGGPVLLAVPHGELSRFELGGL
jgi:hypothetical protein